MGGSQSASPRRGTSTKECAEPFGILSVEEFEYLCAEVEKRRSLTGILRAKIQREARHDHESMSDYLIRTLKTSPKPPTHLQADFTAIGDRFAKQIFGKSLQPPPQS